MAEIRSNTPMGYHSAGQCLHSARPCHLVRGVCLLSLDSELRTIMPIE